MLDRICQTSRSNGTNVRQGDAHPKLLPATTGFDGLSMGFQNVAPGCRIRPHSHDRQIELQIGFSGTGRVVIAACCSILRDTVTFLHICPLAWFGVTEQLSPPRNVYILITTS